MNSTVVLNFCVTLLRWNISELLRTCSYNEEYASVIKKQLRYKTYQICKQFQLKMPVVPLCMFFNSCINNYFTYHAVFMFLCLISLCHDQYFKPALGLRLRLKQNITSKIDANTSGIIVLYSLLTLIYTNSFQFTYAGF